MRRLFSPVSRIFQSVRGYIRNIFRRGTQNSSIIFTTLADSCAVVISIITVSLFLICLIAVSVPSSLYSQLINRKEILQPSLQCEA